MDHLKGKTVPEHLKDARIKGATAFSEIHGVEMSGAFSSGIDAAKECAILLALLSLLPSFSFKILLLFGGTWALWKTVRSALLGYHRIERLHRLIEEERWEIEHHRKQEKEELKEMYRAKGLTGKLLDDTVEVLMADDNRLLQVMLEEELGLSLEVYEHPLRQAAGALLGSLVALFGVLLCAAFFGPIGLICGSFLTCSVTAIAQAVKEKNRRLPSLVWNLSALALLLSVLYYLLHVRL